MSRNCSIFVVTTFLRDRLLRDAWSGVFVRVPRSVCSAVD